MIDEQLDILSLTTIFLVLALVIRIAVLLG
jgi:hypothetical protein